MANRQRYATVLIYLNFVKLRNLYRKISRPVSMQSIAFALIFFAAQRIEIASPKICFNVIQMHET